MKVAVFILWSTCLCFVFDVGNCSTPGPISTWNNTNPAADHDVSDTRMRQFGDKWLPKIANVTMIQRCCVNGDCRVLLDGETCEPKRLAYFTYVHNKKPQPISSTDVLSKKPKNKSSGHVVTPVGFDENKLVTRFRYQVLNRSNFYRHNYGVFSLSMDEKMNSFAQDWANVLAVTGERRHRPSNPFGENIYFTTAESDNLGEVAVDAWFEEIAKFNGSDEESRLFANSATHHMTQLLWKSSSKLGVGVSKNPYNKFKYIVVANYNPPGNVYGHFKINLPEVMQK